MSATTTIRSGRVAKGLLTLLVLALLAVTLQSFVFSGASFTATRSNPGNAFTAGTLSHVNSGAGEVVLNAAGLRPGQSSHGTLTVTGGGDVSGVYTISKVSLVDTPASPALSAALTLLIEDITGTPATLFSGTPAAFSSASAGTIAPGVTRTYRVTLTFPLAAANPQLQGATMALRLRFTGVAP